MSCHICFSFSHSLSLPQHLLWFESRPLWICRIHLNFLIDDEESKKNCVWRDEAEWKKSITTPNLCICWRFKYTFNRFISNSSFKCCSFQWDIYLNERREIKLRSTSGMQWLTQWYGTPSNICQISWLNWTDGLDRIASHRMGSDCQSVTVNRTRCKMSMTAEKKYIAYECAFGGK